MKHSPRLLFVLPAWFLIVFCATPQLSELPVGWCNDEGCDDSYQDGGSANCSAFQIIITQQIMRDARGRPFATGYTFESQDTNNGTPCYAAWSAMNVTNGYSVLFTQSVWIGTLNTKIFFGDEKTIGSSTWFSTKMLSDSDESGTCVSSWWTGTDVVNEVGSTFNIKLIAGGPNC